MKEEIKKLTDYYWLTYAYFVNSFLKLDSISPLLLYHYQDGQV